MTLLMVLLLTDVSETILLPAYNISVSAGTFCLPHNEMQLLVKRRISTSTSRIHLQGFLGGTVVENLPAHAEDTGSSPGLGRSHMPRSN